MGELAASWLRLAARGAAWGLARRAPGTLTAASLPIVVAGLVWTISGGYLHGLNPRTGRIQQQVRYGQSANDFPTPSVGDGLMLCPATTNVVAFAVSAPK